MSKKTGKVGAQAPKVEQKVNNSKVTSEQMENLTNMSPEQMAAHVVGLDPNHRMDLITVMHETFRKDPMAATHTGMPQETVNSINRINAVMQVAALTCEITLAKNPFTMLLPKNTVDNIVALSGEVGIHLDTKALPAPDANGNIEVLSTAITVSKETKASIEKENAIAEEIPETDGSKVTTEEGVRKGGIYILASTKEDARPYARILSLIKFYRDYLYFRAGDDEAAKKKVSDASNEELFRDVVKIIGPCPFSMHGISNLLYTATATTKSPVSAFCMFRNSTLDKTTGHPTIDDSAVASMVKVLVTWNADSKITADEESIAVCEANIKALSKNKKQNAKAIEKENAKIETYKSCIESYKEVSSFVTNPSTAIADIMPEAYDNREHEEYKNVHRVASEIMKTYYRGITPKQVEHDSLIHNMQQYAGVIINMFRDPLQQNIAYKESNITELIVTNESTEEKVEEPAKEEGSKK